VLFFYCVLITPPQSRIAQIALAPGHACECMQKHIFCYWPTLGRNTAVAIISYWERRQAMHVYAATVRRVRITIVAVEKQ
jgi:hypothetical protein